MQPNELNAMNAEMTDPLSIDKESFDQNQPDLETQLYELRWCGITTFSAGQIITIKFMISLFGVVNNIFEAYFNISYYVIDWFTLVQIPAGFVATIVLANLTFNSVLGFRVLLLILTISILLGCRCSIIAFFYPFLYGLIFVGQICAGFGDRATTATVSSFVTSWFPENQIGLAISIKSMSMSVGSLLSFIVPTQLVSPPPFQENDLSNITSDWKSNETIAEWENGVKWKFISLYGSLIVMSLIVLIFTFICVLNEPPKPPTIAQAKVRAQKKQEKSKVILGNVRQFLRFGKSILIDKVVWQMTIIASIAMICNYLQRVLVGEVLRSVFIEKCYHSEINRMSGFALALHEVGGFAGSLVAGKALDYSKRHKAILLFSLISSALVSLCFTVGCYFVSVVAVFVFNTVLGFTLFATFSPLLDMFLQHTYPKNPSVSTLLFMVVSTVLVIPTTQICRIVLNYVNGPAVLACVAVLF